MTESKKRKITFWSAVLSWLGAACITFISYKAIWQNFDDWLASLILAFAVMTGDKITAYVVEKFHVDVFIVACINWLLEKIGIKNINEKQ